MTENTTTAKPDVATAKNQSGIYRISLEEWEENSKVDLTEHYKSFGKSKSGKSGFKGAYIPVNKMLTLLRAKYPQTYPEMVNYFYLPEGCGMLLYVRLVWPDGVSPTLVYPVMQHGTGRHAAHSEPDARDISDSLQRAFAKLIALETGLGWGIYLGEEPDPEDEEEAKPTRSSRRSRKPEPEEEEEEEEFDYDDDDDEEDEEEEEDEPKKTTRNRRGSSNSSSTRFRRRRG